MLRSLLVSFWTLLRSDLIGYRLGNTVHRMIQQIIWKEEHRTSGGHTVGALVERVIVFVRSRSFCTFTANDAELDGQYRAGLS
jgi:hypothetical protein